jgi:PPK2 family polyphosphate:nucleotide phosphotransferase
MKSFRNALEVKPGDQVRLSDWDPDDVSGWEKSKSLERLREVQQRMYDLQYKLHAESRRSLLIVLQAMDAGGKDGTIRRVMSGLNPQGCHVSSFKVPSSEELAHDFLWRVHRACPRKGEIGIFNRSHYGDVLVVRVHNLVPKSVWSKRYDQINDFEKILTANETRILKFYLHISKEEQAKRLQERITDPGKHWKISEADFRERQFWDDHMKAYEAALTKCSTSWAPWYIIPANKNWIRNLAVAEIITETLESMDLQFPQPSVDVSKLVIE